MTEVVTSVEGSTNDINAMKVSKISKESLKLIRQLARQDEKEDKAALLNEVKPPTLLERDTAGEQQPQKFYSEKAELIKSFEGLSTREEFMRAIISKYEDEKQINILKNELFGIMVLMLNLESVSSVRNDNKIEGKEEKIHPDDILPPATGQNEFLAAASYYKPQGFLRGIETQVDNFVKRNILKDEKSHMTFLRQAFYIIWYHMKQKLGGIKHAPPPDPITPQVGDTKPTSPDSASIIVTDTLPPAENEEKKREAKALDETKIVSEAMNEEARVMSSSKSKKKAKAKRKQKTKE